MSTQKISKQSSRYKKYLKSSHWQRKSRWVRSLTRPWWQSSKKPGRCVLFPWLKAEETHHMTYFFWLKFGWNSFGWELPIWHLVPLSKKAHNFVGKSLLWRQPLKFFVNLYLRIAFLFLWIICRPVWAIPSCLLVAWGLLLVGKLSLEKLKLIEPWLIYFWQFFQNTYQ